MMGMDHPILYSFRRCPYAMRARMALASSGQTVALREIVLRDKPDEMIAASPKATVPVLVSPDGAVLEESIDIALWALAKNDPDGWLPDEPQGRTDMLTFISTMDGPFKHHLDRAKYATRYPEERNDGETAEEFEARHRLAAIERLAPLDAQLAQSTHLFGDRPTLADIATFPFIRQFANSDRTFWEAQPLPKLQAWLDAWVTSDLFAGVMEKYEPWKVTGQDIPFPHKVV
ncbi:MAG: glutathione S-transferase [Pseudomonadota bacterium]